jgi:hypothetical protein
MNPSRWFGIKPESVRKQKGNENVIVPSPIWVPYGARNVPYPNMERIPAFQLGNRWRLKKAIWIVRWKATTPEVNVRNEVKGGKTQHRGQVGCLGANLRAW